MSPSAEPRVITPCGGVNTLNHVFFGTSRVVVTRGSAPCSSSCRAPLHGSCSADANPNFSYSCKLYRRVLKAGNVKNAETLPDDARAVLHACGKTVQGDT